MKLNWNEIRDINLYGGGVCATVYFYLFWMVINMNLNELEQKHKEMGEEIERLKKEQKGDELMWYRDQPIKHKDNTPKRHLSKKDKYYINGRNHRTTTCTFPTHNNFIPDYDAENIITWMPNTGNEPNINIDKHTLVGLHNNGDVYSWNEIVCWADEITHYAIIKPPVKLGD